MKKTTNFLLSTLIALATFLPSTAKVHHDQTSKVTRFDYSTYTY